MEKAVKNAPRANPSINRVVRVRRLWSLGNLMFAFFLGVAIIIIDFIFITLFNLELIISILIATISSIFYAVMLFFLLEPRFMKEIEQNTIETIDRPVEKRIFLERPVIKEVPVDREVIREVKVEVPVDREVIKEVPVAVPVRRSMPSPVHHKYVGSVTTKIYHSTKSRLARLIRPKNRLYGETRQFFEKKGYKPSHNLLKTFEEESRKKSNKSK